MTTQSTPTFINVLDHGFVRLVDSMGSDLSIIRSARVSHNADWRTGEEAGKDEKLIHYLMRNRHTSPFESVQFTFEVKAPIFVFRQWHRHRTWSYNEVSARYSELPEEFYIPDLAVIGTQSERNKQARNLPQPNSVPQDTENTCEAFFRGKLANHSAEGFALYQEALELGIPRELARCFLSTNTYSRMFASVNLHNLFHFLSLRLHPHAQYEIRQYAEALLAIISHIVPVATAAFLEKEGRPTTPSNPPA